MAYANEAEYLDDLEFWLDCNEWVEDKPKANKEKPNNQKQPLMYYADLVGRSG